MSASVVDHIKPHKGDEGLFWDTKNLQSLCSICHQSTKQKIEKRGVVRQIGLDGWPIMVGGD